MTELNTNAIRECVEGSLAGTMTFPEVVARVAAAGVERYSVDLVRMEHTSYSAHGESHVVPLAVSTPAPIAETFSAAAVSEAITAVRNRAVDYQEFLRHIMRAGTVGYSVFVAGQRAVYVGRRGDSHTEPFAPSR
jgi:uncharacterized protein YbcV (DUF1398 family)